MIMRVQTEQEYKLILPVSLMMEKESKKKDKDFKNSMGNYYKKRVRNNFKE